MQHLRVLGRQAELAGMEAYRKRYGLAD
jgi:hypothetical protein